MSGGRRAFLGGVLVLAVVFAMGLAVSAAPAAPLPVEPGTATAEQFPAPGSCGCHSALVEQWSRSMHAQALSDPIYLAKLNEAQKATDGKIGAFCNKCHGPAATMTGEIGKENISAGPAGGVVCSFCHQVVGNEGKPANTSQLVELDGTMRAQLKDPQAPHSATFSEFHTSAEICGGCHNVNHPVNGMHLEATYSEWLKSPYAEEGVTCQMCHMSRQPGVVGPHEGQACGSGPQRPNIFAMSFVGANAILSPPELATAMLQSAADVTLEMPEIVAPGSETSLTVTVTNKGAGHYLPTGLTEVREMWLEVFAENEAGEKTVIAERKFGTILQDDKGNAPVELWEATKIKSDDRIPPRESVEQSATFKMPDGVETANVTAALYYRSVPDELAEKAGVENPVTTMASATQAVFGSEEAKRASATQAAEEPSEGGSEATALVIALVGMAVIIGLVVFFLMRGRNAKAS